MIHKQKDKKKVSLTIKILAALIGGIIVGLVLQDNAEFADNYIKPFGCNH